MNKKTVNYEDDLLIAEIEIKQDGIGADNSEIDELITKMLGITSAIGNLAGLSEHGYAQAKAAIDILMDEIQTCLLETIEIEEEEDNTSWEFN